jgi:hypothetical protein
MRYGLLMPCLALLFYGCGDGAICFGGTDCGGDDSDRTVTVEGNINSVRPPNAVRDLVVFAYTRLENAPPFTTYKHGESKVVSDDDTFTVSRVARGNITVVLLLDDPQPDGSIDCVTDDNGNIISCDDCSVLRDRGKLSDVPGGRRVTIEDMDVDFDVGSCPTPPPIAGCGCSTAYRIAVSRDSSGTGGTGNADSN